MVAEREASLLLRGQDQGVNKLLSSVAKSSQVLNEQITEAGSSFVELGQSIPDQGLKKFGKNSKFTVGSLGKLNRSMKGTAGGYGNLINKTEQANKTLEVSDNLFVKLGASALGYGNTVETINSGLGPAAGFWQDYSKASTGAGKALLVVKTAGKGLNPVLSQTSGLAEVGAERLREMGGAAGVLAGPLEGLAKNLNKTKKGLKIVSLGSDISQVVDSIKDFKEETLPELQEQLEEGLETLDKLGLKEKFFGDTFKTLQTSATVLSATTKGLTKDVSGLFLKFVSFKEIQSYVSVVATGLTEVKRTMSDVYRAVDEFQALGIDTTFQESALAIGIFGEKLLFSTEAAKKFRIEAVGAFVQLQDQVAYLTTLSTAAEIGQKRLGQSILDLVNGPLKNAVSALDAASGLYDAISAGQSSIDFLNASLKFSAATGASAADSIGALAQVHNIYRLNARDATKTAALFNATIENGVVNGAQLSSGIGQLASVAKEAGIGLVELNAMFASLTKNGFSAADAFQGLMSLITSIAGQGSESAKAAQELGIRFDFARIKAEGLVKPINELYAATNGSVSRIKTIVPDSLAFRTAMALATSASEDFIDVQSKMEDIDTGSLDVVFERRRDSILERSKALKEGFQNEMVAFGEALQQTMEPALTASEQVLEKFRNLPGFAKNGIIFAAQAGIQIEKLTKSGSILTSTIGGLAKAFVLAKGSALLFTGAGREKLRTIIDLVKNQKDYTGAMKTFLGVSDSLSEKIKHLTGLEKSQLLTNQKVLSQRKKAIAELSKFGGESGINLFAQSNRSIKKTVNKAFANATPAVKIRANELRSTIQEQFTDFKQQGGKSNLIVRTLGLDKIKDTEADLAAAMEKIERTQSEGYFRGSGLSQAEKTAYKERLALIEDNIKQRQNLLGLSRNQMEIEQKGVASINQQLNVAAKTTKGSLQQGKDLITQTIASKTELLNTTRSATAEQLSQIDADIKNQFKNLSPRFASILANKTGAELDTALTAIRANISDDQVEQLAQTIAKRKEVVKADKEQTRSLKAETKALKDSVSGRKLDLVARQKSLNILQQEITGREESIKQLQGNNKIDFLQIIGDEDIKEKIQAGFSTASEEVQANIAQLSEDLQQSSEEILDDEEATSLLEAIGLGDVESSIGELEGVVEKLDEIKEAGEVDPEAVALVEENLEQRQALAAATATQTAALRAESASLTQNSVAISANNVQKAQAIGFTGPLAAWNVKLVASYYAVTQALNSATAAGTANTVGLRAKVVWNKLAAIASLGFAGAIKTATIALNTMWLTLGVIGTAVGALVAIFVVFSKVKGHLDMLSETADAFDAIALASQNFKEQLVTAKDMKQLAKDLQEYNKELQATAAAAKLTGKDYEELKDKVKDLNDTGGKSLDKISSNAERLSKVNIAKFASELDSGSQSLLEFNSATEEAFDSTKVGKAKDSAKAIADRLGELAAQARLAGEELEAIKLEKFAKEAEGVADGLDAFEEKFVESLDKKTRKRYLKEKEDLAEEIEKQDRKARAKRGDKDAVIREYIEFKQTYDPVNVFKKKIVDIGEAGLKLLPEESKKSIEKIRSFTEKQTLEVVKNYTGKGEEEAKKTIENLKGNVKELMKTKVKNSMDIALTKSKARIDDLNDSIRSINNGELLGDADSAAAKILAAAKKNNSQAALNSEQFKKLQAEEKKSLQDKSAEIDAVIKAEEEALKVSIESNTITSEETAERTNLIEVMKELNSLRETDFKQQQKEQKEAQAALAAIDLNNAAVSVENLQKQFNRARVKVIQETVDDTVKAANTDIFESIVEDAENVANIPNKLKTASLDAFNSMAQILEEGMNTTSTYQRRQLGITINGLAELATNVENTEKKGLEASRKAINKTFENVENLMASGALDPKRIGELLNYADNLRSKISLTEAEGDIKLAQASERSFELRLKNDQEVVNRKVAVNQRGIKEIAHLEALALLTSQEAQAERTELELINNKMLFEVSEQRYRKISEMQGTTSSQALTAYGEMIEAERTLEQSQFGAKRAKEARELALLTANISLETQEVTFAYQQELDLLGLISSELERQEKLIAVYNQSVSTSLTFLDGVRQTVTATVKDTRNLSSLQERNAVRQLDLLEIQQKQQYAAQKRQIERNQLTAEEALIQNDIAIAEKEREIRLARLNFEQEKRTRKLRQDEKDAFDQRLLGMERERSLLDVQQEKLTKNYQVEQDVSVESLRQLELKQEQTKSSGVLDVINAKLGKISAQYKEQEKIVAAVNNSFNTRLGYTNNILGLTGSLTKDEKEQKRLAQIVAATKVKALKEQQRLEQKMLQIQQAQQLSLLQQEKIKLRLLKAQQKIAIAEDTSKLAEARKRGDKEAEKNLINVLNSRVEALSTIEFSNKSLKQQEKLQKSLFRIQSQDLELKQKSDKFAALVELNQTRPDGRRKDLESKRLRRRLLQEVGLNNSSLRRQTFNAPTANLPKEVNLNLPDEVDLGRIIGKEFNNFFDRLGTKIEEGVKSQTLEQEFARAKRSVSSRSSSNIVDYLDPSLIENFRQNFALTSVKSEGSRANIPDIGINSNLSSPAPIGNVGANINNDLTIAQQQLETQKELVQELKNQQRKIEMFNEVNLTVLDSNEATDELEDVVLDTFDRILDQTQTS